MSADQIVINAEAVGYPDFHRIADAVEGVHRECDRSSCCYRMVADEIRGQLTPPKPTTREVTLTLDGRHAFLPEFLRFVASHADEFNADLVADLADQIEAQSGGQS